MTLSCECSAMLGIGTCLHLSRHSSPLASCYLYGLPVIRWGALGNCIVAWTVGNVVGGMGCIMLHITYIATSSCLQEKPYTKDEESAIGMLHKTIRYFYWGYRCKAKVRSMIGSDSAVGNIHLRVSYSSPIHPSTQITLQYSLSSELDDMVGLCQCSWSKCVVEQAGLNWSKPEATQHFQVLFRLFSPRFQF